MSSLNGVVDKAELKKMIDEMPDDASGMLIIADTSPCRDEDGPCDCGHYNGAQTHRFGKAKEVPHAVYLLQAIINCLFNR